MALILTTPGISLNSTSILKEVEFKGDFSRKILTVKNTGISSVTFTISLSQGGSGDAFKLVPRVDPAITPNSIVTTIDSDQSFSFAVDYNSLDGEATTASIISDTDIYNEDETQVVIGTSRSLDFLVTIPEVTTRRQLGPLLNKDADGNFTIQQAASKFTQDETSFGVIRTNPKLTGNVKITIDSSENLWLNSIDADKELADDRFKKYKISPDSSYVVDLKRFFDFGQTPSEIVFALYQKDPNYITTKRSFDQQYDNFYHYGAEQLKSRFYDEEFSFLAPIYLKQEVPEYFVIFRTEGPINEFTYQQPKSEWVNSINSEILSKSEIVKVFDLTENSKIGRYLRKIITHPSRRDSDITVSFQTNGYTTFNGISYSRGTFTESGELLFDYYNEENPILSSEEFITLGFQRNKVVSSHLFNLEFLFNDEDAENYSINRYFGLYVNAIDLASFNLNGDALSEYALSINQKPLPRKGIDGSKVSQKSFVQTNSNGVKLYIDNDSIDRVPSLSTSIFSSTIENITIGIGSFSVNLPGKQDDKISNGEVLTFFNATLTATAEVSNVVYQGDFTTVTFDSSTFLSTVTLSVFSNLTWNLNFYTQEKFRIFNNSVFDNNFINDSTRFFYIKDNQNFLHSVEKTQSVLYNVDSFTQKETIEISLKDNKVDIANFSGFSNILTQTEAKLLNRGHSSLSIEILKYFSPNDFLEIRWEPGPQNSEYPLRWRVIANSSNTNPGESWPSFGINSDSEGDYYFSYFNPGNDTVTLEKFVESIQEAFNNFTFKNFEVLAKGNFLYFRSTQDGRNSESTKFLYTVQQSDTIKVMGIPSPLSGNVNFIGGSDRNRTRARISKSVAQGMLIDEYLSTNGSFSSLRQYEILNQKIIFSPYLEEPVYDEEGEKLVDFVGSDEYMVISLDTEISEIQLTSDKKITTYQLFKPKYGILSVFPLKDFDTDYYESDYSKTYTPELIKYFFRDYQPTKIVNVSGNVYTFDKDFEFDSYPVKIPFLKLSKNGTQTPTLFNANAQLEFNGPGNVATLLESSINDPLLNPIIDNTLLFLTPEKVIYFQDPNLSKFKGFLNITSITSSEDESLFLAKENLWDPTRFNPEITSEYDRISENFLKTLVLKSRVVPYSLKWVSPQGRDVRDNPYRFNYHRAFGNMNFSPTESISDAEPIFFTHEWPYLETLPDKFPVAQFPEYTFSYFFDELDKYDFSSLQRDWFSLYFSTGYPLEEAKNDEGNFSPVKIDPFEKYSYFNFDKFTDRTFTFFRGYRIEINQKNLQTDEIIRSKKYDNYKFSVIMKTVEENPFEYQDPVTFKTIVNEKWKFIVLIITVKTASFRFPEGNLGYLDLYTLGDANYFSRYDLDTSNPLYQLDGFYQALPKDKKLSNPINIQSNSSDTSLTNPYNYYDAYTTDNFFVDNLVNQIIPSIEGNFSEIVTIYQLFNFETTVTLPKPRSVFDLNTLQLSNDIAYVKLSSVPLVSTISIPYSTISWENHIFYHQGGGNNSLTDIAKRVSFAEISKVINGVSDKAIMEYQVIKEDGSISNVADFSLKTVSPETLERVFDFLPVTDLDKPSEFYNVENVSVVLEERKDLQTLYRYQGNFSPKFKNVLKFWLRESEDFTNVTVKDFLFSNTHIGTELKDFSLLKNQFYNKVSDSEILTISPDSGYSPVYPLVNEIAIDKKDIFTWSSSWDQFYYRKYLNTSEFQEVRGTEEMKEQKSFFGSKMMKVPNQFDLYEFKLIEVNSLNDLEISEEEFVYFQTEEKITLQINVFNRLLREMLGTSQDPKASKIFQEIATNISGTFNLQDLKTKVEEYLIDNIIDLYEVSEVEFYLLQTGNAEEGQIETLNLPQIPRPIVEFNQTTEGNFTLEETQLVNKNYLLKKDTKLKKLNNLKFSIEFPLDSRFYTSLSIGTKVKRI